MAFSGVPKFDMKAIAKYASPQAFDDLNHFIENLPQNAGKTILMTAAVAWAVAGALGLFTTIKAQELNNLRAQLQDAKALKPIVPVLSEVGVEPKEMEDFSKKLNQTYKSLDFRPQGNKISITGAQTTSFNAFREAVLQVQNGGLGWKVGLEKMCVGRECKQNHLSISLKINKINIDKPAADSISYVPGQTTE